MVVYSAAPFMFVSTTTIKKKKPLRNINKHPKINCGAFALLQHVSAFFFFCFFTALLHRNESTQSAPAHSQRRSFVGILSRARAEEPAGGSGLAFAAPVVKARVVCGGTVAV